MGCIRTCFGEFDLPIFKKRLSRAAEDELAEFQWVNRHDSSLMLKVLYMPYCRLYWSGSHFREDGGGGTLDGLVSSSKMSQATHWVNYRQKAQQKLSAMAEYQERIVPA